MFEELEVRIQLRETKPDGKVRRKFTRKARRIYNATRLKQEIEETPDRSNQNLFITVHEIDENDKAKRTPIIEKEIFPQDKIEYIRVAERFQHEPSWNDTVWFSNKLRGLFKYFARTKGLDPEADFFYESDTEEDYAWARAFPKTLEGVAWTQFREEWQEYHNWQNLKNNLMKALADPSTENPQEFQSLLADQRIIDRVLAQDTNERWEVRQSSEDGKYLLLDEDGNSIKWTKSDLTAMVKKMTENHHIDLLV
jgi:hypothetical protein